LGVWLLKKKKDKFQEKSRGEEKNAREKNREKHEKAGSVANIIVQEGQNCP